MFEHLLSPEYDDIAKAEASAIVDAQTRTLDFMAEDELGDATPFPGLPPAVGARDSALAQQAFTAMVSNPSPDEQRAAVLNLRTPAAVRHHVAMLSAYDWDFVEEAKRLRGYVVSKLLDETKHPDAKIRLKSLELVGKLTEVASFTERSEVIHKNENSSEIEERLRARLKSLLPPTLEIQDTEVKEIAVVKHERPVPSGD
jgi:hypothetical protein